MQQQQYFEELARIIKPRSYRAVAHDFMDAEAVKTAAEELLAPSYGRFVKKMVVVPPRDDGPLGVSRILLHGRSAMKVCVKLTKSVKTVFAVEDGRGEEVVLFGGGRTCRSAMTTSMMLSLVQEERRSRHGRGKQEQPPRREDEDDGRRRLWRVLHDDAALPDGGDIPGGRELLKHMRPYLYERACGMFAADGGGEDHVFLYREGVVEEVCGGDGGNRNATPLAAVLRNAVEVAEAVCIYVLHGGLVVVRDTKQPLPRRPREEGATPKKKTKNERNKRVHDVLRNLEGFAKKN